MNTNNLKAVIYLVGLVSLSVSVGFEFSSMPRAFGIFGIGCMFLAITSK